MNKKEHLFWMCDIEYIFTKERLKELKRLDFIDSIDADYFKKGCKKEFLKALNQQHKKTEELSNLK